MNRSVVFSGEEQLRFFGRIMASINHDIRNILATINENAGLLMDYAEASSIKKPLDSEKAKTLAQRITEQIKRADGLLRRMGNFSHSVDESLKCVDLNEVLQVLINLSERLAATNRVTIHMESRSDPVEIRTSPFLLFHVLFLCLEFAVQATGKGNRLNISLRKSGSDLSVRFGPLKRLSQMPLESMPSTRIPDYLPLIRTSFIADTNYDDLVVVFYQESKKEW